MPHEADAMIESVWMGKTVRQVAGLDRLIGRTGIVLHTFFDENGALHCKMDAGAEAWWCPAALLTIVE